MSGSNPQQVANTEDLMQEAALGRPTLHQHYALYTKQSDSIWKKILATRDIFFQGHSDVIDCIKYSLKGSLVGALIGLGIWTSHFYEESTFTNRKAFQWGEQQNLGIYRVFWKYSSKFFVMGALMGAAWFVWWRKTWSDYGQRNDLLTYAGAYSSFFGLAAGFYHPRAMQRAAVFGLGLGIYMNYISNAQLGIDKTQIGFAYEIPGFLTEEQREEQRKKDYIFMLGQCYQVKMQQLKEL